MVQIIKVRGQMLMTLVFPLLGPSKLPPALASGHWHWSITLMSNVTTG